MNKKWIVIPDVHGRKFWRDVVKGNEDERIIFLGDYLDPYSEEGITPEDAYNELLDIIAFKKEHPDNVTLLLGNHDLGYLDSNICSFRQDKQKIPHHGLDLSCLYAITFRHTIDNNRISTERCYIKTKRRQHKRMFLNQTHILHSHIHSYRKKSGLGLVAVL